MDPLQDQEKWDFAIIYYTLARSKVSKKIAFWVPFWDNLGDKIVEIGVQMSSQKSSENRHPHSVMLGSILGQLLSKKLIVCRSKSKCVLCVCVACWGQGSWIYQNGSQNRRCWVLKSMIFVTFFDRFFVDFMLMFCWFSVGFMLMFCWVSDFVDLFVDCLLIF